jgi:transcriptional regulator with XRE-family HTH domain
LLAGACLFLFIFLILIYAMLNGKNSARSPKPHVAKRKSVRSTARAKEPNFGEVIRSRRRELDLTQDEVASRIKASTPYVGHLESSKRHPSDKIVTRLAEVLGFDSRELFFLANPHTEALLSAPPERTEGSVSAWDQFRENDQLRRIHNVSNNEMEMLSQVALLGEIQSPRDLIYILNTVRHAVGR